MRDYELALVLPPQEEKEEQEKLLTKIGEQITKLKGEVKQTEAWGKKGLVYPLKRFEEGIFFLLKLVLPPEAVLDLEKKIRTEEKILRHLLVRAEDLPAGRQGK